MTDSQSLKVFKCPSCGAPLNPTPGMAAMKCPYCAASVIIPETLRGMGSSKTTDSNDAPASLSDVTRLAKQGRLEEAAKIYSKITGLSHEYAMLSVKSMAGIRDDEPAPVAQTPSRSSTSYSRPEIFGESNPTPQPVMQGGYSHPQTRRRRGGSSCFSFIGLIIALVVFVLPKVGGLLPDVLPFELPAGIPFLSPTEEVPPFADQVTIIGRQGTEPGMFREIRHIGIDGVGNIAVFNYGDGLIQVFNGNGEFISEFTPNDYEQAKYSQSMAVSSDGRIYIVVGQNIHVYNQAGELLEEISDDEYDFEYAVLDSKGGLFAVADKDFETVIVRFNSSGAIDFEIIDPLSYIGEDGSLSGIIGLDAAGNVYFNDTFLPIFLKFSPSGEFIGTFGEELDAGDGYTPGKFRHPLQFTTDKRGRIYVVDFFDTQVFDANLNYLARIPDGVYGIAFDAQNNMYATSTLDKVIVKFNIQDSSGQP